MQRRRILVEILVCELQKKPGKILMQRLKILIASLLYLVVILSHKFSFDFVQVSFLCGSKEVDKGDCEWDFLEKTLCGVL